MRFLIVGAGSIGGYFGARLAQAGEDVTFLVRPKRAQALREAGLQVESPYGDVTIAPQLVTADTIKTTYDVVILAVKAYGLEQSIRDMAPAIGPGSMILPLLNGMRHLDKLRDAFGADKLLGGLCKISTTLDAAGRVLQFGRMQDLVYGEMDGSKTPRIQELDRALTKAIAGSRLSPNILQEMWEKWAMLSSLAAITCLMRASTGAVEAAPGGRDFINAILDEVVATIGAASAPLGDAFVADVRAMLTEKGSPRTASMFRDLSQGFPVEADQILGDLVARAKAAGIATPLLGAAYTHLAVYQEAQRAG